MQDVQSRLPSVFLAMTLAVCMAVPAAELGEGEIVVLEERLIAMDDLSLTKTKGKYKYKKEDPADAQQGWTIAGEMPTAHQSFQSMGSVHVRGRRAGDVDALDHRVYLQPSGVKGREGTRFKQRFTYVNQDRSRNGYRERAWGFLKMWLERSPRSTRADGATSGGTRLRFLYCVTKANQGGQLLETEYQDDIKQKVAQEKKISGQENLEFGFQAGSEPHMTSATAKFKAKKKGARGKIF
jgi:hypothetical protein